MKKNKNIVNIIPGEFFKNQTVDFIKAHPFLCLGLACLLINILVTISSLYISAKRACILYVFFILIVAALALLMRIKGRLSERKIIFFLGVTSFLLHVTYIFYTVYTTRQHDVFFKVGGGHLAYIEYFLNNNFRLPDFDPTTVMQFYHPPLHHFLSAVWVKINVLLGMKYSQAIESVQILTLFYSGCITIISYKIFKEFNFKKIALIIPFAIVCFHPTLTILSGSINNDILCITLMLATVLLSIRWYKNPRMLIIIQIAVCLGLSMMTKTSGVLLVPAVVVIFALKIIRQKDIWKKLASQIAVFGAISIPLGLWWNFYNLIKYKMPLFYIPKPGNIEYQYIGDLSVLNRLFDFNLGQLKNVFLTFAESNKDHNLFIVILKSAMFGEYNFGVDGLLILLANILFYSNVLIVLISLICLLKMILKKYVHVEDGIKIFFAVAYCTILGLYIKTCFDIPWLCTHDFRYIVPTFIIGTTAIGMALMEFENSDSKQVKIFVKTIAVLTVLFCISSIAVYIMLGVIDPDGVNHLNSIASLINVIK